MRSQAESGITTKTYVFSYLGLVVLTALTFGVSFVKLGPWETPVALGIAAVKSLIVALYFMHLIEQPASHRIAGVAAILLIGILVALAAADVVTRGRPPLSQQVSVERRSHDEPNR